MVRKAGVSSLIVVACALALAGCTALTPTGTSTPASTSSTTDTPSRSAAPAVTYTSTSFLVPFEVDVPAWLPSIPTIDSSNFVTWEASDQIVKVRMLLPVSVYRPGDFAPTAVPTDYLGYLLGQQGQGAQFSDRVTTTVGGREATILTVTTTKSLDGSLGCAGEEMVAADCFGVQPDLRLRMAVVPVEFGTVLVWLRDDEPSENFADSSTEFDKMLAGLRFTSR